MILIIDTTKEGTGISIKDKLEEKPKYKSNNEYIDASGLNISHCLGCNFCWLKTPGECVVKDDYETILKKISNADQVWPDYNSDYAFTNEIVVKPFDDGTFKIMSNDVTEQELKLPPVADSK